MKEIAIFGGGEYGKKAAIFFKKENRKIAFFIDNSKEKQGTKILDISVIGLDEAIKFKECVELFLAINVVQRNEIINQLRGYNWEDFKIFDFENYVSENRIISYAKKGELEDVILYHVLKNEKEIFYIDVGSNDPFEQSVTKLLYDMKAAHGINIEPQKKFYELTLRERPRDICLCVGVGEKVENGKIYHQGGRSTFVEDNVINMNTHYEDVHIITLKDVCEKYVNEGQEISILKIDVEGYEKAVLLGCDFKKYRPWIIEIEAANPITGKLCYDEWENILLDNEYHFVQMVGINRYYVSNEKSYLDKRFCKPDELNKMYEIYYTTVTI